MVEADGGNAGNQKRPSKKRRRDTTTPVPGIHSLFVSMPIVVRRSGRIVSNTRVTESAREKLRK